MGTVFKLPMVELGQESIQYSVFSGQKKSPAAHQDAGKEPGSLRETLLGLKARGVRCIAAHPHVEKRTLSDADFTEHCCLVFGSEGYGISESVHEVCDDSVAIPMRPGIDSLNVASAAAVFLYEVNRQRARS